MSSVLYCYIGYFCLKYACKDTKIFYIFIIFTNNYCHILFLLPSFLSLISFYFKIFFCLCRQKKWISFCSLCVYSYLCNRICVCGGIGRRARLRIWYLTMCRFDSCQTHKSEQGLQRQIDTDLQMETLLFFCPK